MFLHLPLTVQPVFKIYFSPILTVPHTKLTGKSLAFLSVRQALSLTQMRFLESYQQVQITLRSSCKLISRGMYYTNTEYKTYIPVSLK